MRLRPRKITLYSSKRKREFLNINVTHQGIRVHLYPATGILFDGGGSVLV